jgi:hypothetical protein
LGTTVVATPDTTLLPKRGIVRPLVQDGVVVTPVRTREVPISSSSLMQGTTTRTVPVQEIVLAVDPQEVAPLAEAMDLEYEIICVARSGRPVSPSPLQPAASSSSSAGTLSRVFTALTHVVQTNGRAAAPGKAAPPERIGSDSRDVSGTAARNRLAADITPGLDPMAQTRYMEFMIGSQRQFVLFTGPGNSPVLALQDDGSAKAGSGVVPAGAAGEDR